MRKQVGNVKHRVALLLADADIYFFTVLKHNDAVQGKRNCKPMILFDTAVIVSF